LLITLILQTQIYITHSLTYLFKLVFDKLILDI